MEWIIIAVIATIVLAFISASKTNKKTSTKSSTKLYDYDIYEKPIDNGLEYDEYYYSKNSKVISLYKRQGYDIHTLVGMRYRDLAMSDLGKFEGYAEAQEDNEFDDYAVAIYSHEGTHLGFIPSGNEEAHQYILDNFGTVDAYGYIAYSENDGFYGAVCVEYNDDLDDNF